MNKLISKVGDYVYEVWHLHCDTAHGNDFQSKEQHTTLTRKVEDLYPLEPWVDIAHKEIFAEPLDTLKE